MRILGIDPGVAIVGFGVLDCAGATQKMVQYGAINTPAGMPLAARLTLIESDLTELIRQFHPYEYTPMQVKQAVVGYGLAEKKQVMDMTRRLLKLKDIPRPDDAADALAIAICHARSATSRLRRTDPNVKETV